MATASPKPEPAVPAIIPHRYAVVPVASVRPHPANANQGDVEAIGESLDSLGFYGVILVHEQTGHILAGEHRWRAATARGMPDLPAVIITCSEDAARRIMAGDNQYARLATWDTA